MPNFDIFRSESEQSENSSVVVPLVFLGLGLLLGYGIGGEMKSRSTLEWAVKETSYCEKYFKEEEFSSVTDCLKQSIEVAEAERREEAKAEGYDPRR